MYPGAARLPPAAGNIIPQGWGPAQSHSPRRNFGATQEPPLHIGTPAGTESATLRSVTDSVGTPTDSEETPVDL